MLFIAWQKTPFSLAFLLHRGLDLDWNIHTNRPHKVGVFQLLWFSHLATWDRFHPLTTVIVWTPICQETLHTDGERENTEVGWWRLISPSLTGPGSKYFLSGLMRSRWHVCGPTWARMHPRSASIQRVCLSATHAACGSYTGIVRTRRGALFPLCLPGAAFHPRWAGRQARSLGC